MRSKLPTHLPPVLHQLNTQRLVCMFPRVQVIAGLGFFSAFKSLSDSEDSDSPAVYGDLFPSSGVPSGIVL